MKKKTFIVSSTILITLLSGTLGIFASSDFVHSVYKTNELILLEQAKFEFETQNKEVPDYILEKIKAEAEYSQTHAYELQKREKEIQQIEEIRKNAPKDEKGNPIIPIPTFTKIKPEPYEEAGQVGNREYAESFFPRSFTYNNDLVSAITSSYHVLVSGIDKNNPEHSFIIHINNIAEGDQPSREQFDFTGKGPIIFEKLIDDHIATFKFDGDQEGHFDINDNSISFSAYGEEE